jgi:hypothetical protein
MQSHNVITLESHSHSIGWWLSSVYKLEGSQAHLHKPSRLKGAQQLAQGRAPPLLIAPRQIKPLEQSSTFLRGHCNTPSVCLAYVHHMSMTWACAPSFHVHCHWNITLKHLQHSCWVYVLCVFLLAVIAHVCLRLVLLWWVTQHLETWSCNTCNMLS